MNCCIILAAIVAGAFLALPAMSGPPEARLSLNRMLIVNGRPRFLIGLYEHPKSDTKLKEAVEAGIDLIHCPADRDALDRVQRFGAWGWLNTGYALDLSEEAEKRKTALAEMVRNFGDHPGLLIWEGPDEALWNCWYGTMQQIEAEFVDMATEAQRDPALRPVLAAARDAYDRALWKQWEALRADFWRRAGKPCPYANARMDAAEARAARMGDGFAAGARFLRQLDPKHFIWLNHAPRNSIRAMRQHNRAVDMAGCDIYPIPYNLATGHSDLVNMRPSSVGDYTDRMREGAPGKACAMVLQGFGWRDLEDHPDETRAKAGFGRRPNLQEQRFMAWDAIVHGANAILYWGTAYLKDPESAESRKFWLELLQVTAEVRSYERFIVEPDYSPAPTVRVEEHYASNDGTGVRVVVKKAGSDYLIIVVNENPYGVAFTINGLPAPLEGQPLRSREHSAGDHTVRGRALRDGIRGFDVELYVFHG